MKTILITGADGHLGRAIAAWLLQHSESHLLLWLRAGFEAEQQAKIESLADLMSSGRCRVAFGDLTSPEPFSGLPESDIDAIVHCAAAIDFNVEQERARAVNIDGSRKLFEFAERCDRLERLVYLSSLYAVGLQGAELDECLLDDSPGFANHYEWSKWQVEKLLADRYRHLPWQILRIATVIADDASGRVTQHNVVHNTMRLMYYGLLSIVPGQGATRVYLTTTDFIATACGRLLLDGPERELFHLCDDAADALRLEALLDIVYERFLQQDGFRQRRILKPLFCDQDAFDTLLSGASQHSDVLGQALGSVAPFAPQLFSDKAFSTANLARALPDLRAPRVAQIMPRVGADLIANHWHRKTAEGISA